MQRQLVAMIFCLLGTSLTAAERSEWFTAKLEDMELKVRLIRDTDEMRARLGSDLDREFIVVETEVRPLYNTKVVLNRDDFLLRSYRNNDRSRAQSPERIAGGSVLVVGSGRTTRGAGVFSESREPVVIGGAPGTGTRPRRIDGPADGIGGGGTSTTSIEVKEGKQSTTSLLDRLKEMELPMGETRTTARGYLYFQIDPKNKPKNLALTYDGELGECKIEFNK